MGTWVERKITVPPLPRGDAASGLFVNVPGTIDLGSELLRCVAAARRSVMFINPLITDERLTEGIVSARARGVKVKVVTELRENRGSGIKYPTRGFDVSDQRVLNEHFMAVRHLAKNRVLCRGLRHYAHAKFLIVDEERLLISSANGTSNSLGWGLRPSIEAGVGIDDAVVVAKWVAAFKHVWEECPFQQHLLDKDVSVQESSPSRKVSYDLPGACGEGRSAAWSYPPHGRSLRDTLVRLVKLAQRHATIVALSFFDIDGVDALHAALLGALERKVRVTVIVRPEHFREDQFPDAGTRHLLERGLRLLGIPAMHAKGIVVDNAACAIFSANINPFSLDSDADSAHVECGLGEEGGMRLLNAYGSWITALEAASVHEYAL